MSFLSRSKDLPAAEQESSVIFGVPSEKRLRWSIQRGEGAEFLTITPALAEQMMKRNTDEDYQNRPLSRAAVKRYAKAMKLGWVVTGETIIFSSDGVLLNGQHRLQACIESGCAFRTLVVYGIDRAAFKYMDRGAKRSPSDVFSIEGVPNCAVMAAATLWVHNITNHGGWTGNPEQRVENDQLLEIYYANDRLQESAWVAGAISREGEHLIAPSLMTALHYLFAQKSRSAADDFMQRVITGVGIASNKDPEHAIRKWLLKDNMETGGRTNNTYRAAYVVLAWNARRHSKPIKLFRWRTDQQPNASFPAIR